MPDLILNGIRVEDTFAEAFDMAATALVLTAETPEWATIAATTMTGFATSVIGCGAEAGIDAVLSPTRPRTGAPACGCCSSASMPAASRTSSCAGSGNAC